MKWFEISIKTTQEAQDAITEMLTTVGAGGVAIEDPFEIRKQIEAADSLDYADDEFMKNLGDDVIIKAYFSGTLSIAELTVLIKEKLSFISQFLDIGKGFDVVKEVDDEDWATAWKKYYKPLHISEKVVIKPSWEEYQKVEGEVVIELDPGMAFGTGTHETTRLCAQLIEKYIKPEDVVLDVGCGTGILAVIAAKLGAESVLAVDIDEIAVRVANENCEINNVNDVVKCKKAVLKDIEPFKNDIIVANIIANVIIDLSSIIPYYLKDNGFFITSGIIRERKDEVIEAYNKAGYVLKEVLEMGEWVAMVFA